VNNPTAAPGQHHTPAGNRGPPRTTPVNWETPDGRHRLHGTSIGAWHWTRTLPGLGITDGNPLNGAASGYVAFDVMAMLVAPTLVYAAAKLKPKRATRRVHDSREPVGALADGTGLYGRRCEPCDGAISHVVDSTLRLTPASHRICRCAPWFKSPAQVHLWLCQPRPWRRL
jgi:hypothetical protein